MSLWQKSIAEITYAELDAFCTAKVPEGARLDYKRDFPHNLEKTIAAFANTVGGLIVIGVDSDPKTNEPVWPPVSGVPLAPGLQERVYQKATEAVHPPVRVSVSPVIEIPSLPGQCAIVIRVDESKDAPHAVEKGREVYVYERSDNKTDPIRLAHIDRIEYLLNRRKRIEEEREAVRSKAIARAERLITEGLKPIIWVSVIPVYPWRDLCRPSRCYNHLRFTPYPEHTIRRIPDGAMHIWEVNLTQLGACVCETITCDSRGHFLYLRGLVAIAAYATETYGVFRPTEMAEREFDFDSVTQRVGNMFDAARKFYRMESIDQPGLLSVELGMTGVRGIKIYQRDKSYLAKPYLDDDYFDERVFPIETFLSNGEETKVFYDRIAFAFDVASPEGQ